jgi:hypothetical protein
MKPQILAIIDDREPLPPELKQLIGDIHFGDLLRRRSRYLDELRAACAGADDVVVLRSAEDTKALVRRIESARGDRLWLRLPTTIAPMDMDRLDFVIRKMRFALGSMLLAPVMEDDAPIVLTSTDALALLAAPPGKDRRTLLLQLANVAEIIAPPLHCLDLRQADALREFLSSATEPRAFNRLSVEKGVVVKSSSDISKMRAEHGYFEIAPPEMRRFLLPTFDYSEQDGRASYKMEHLRVPDASLQFVLGAFSEALFDQLLDKFFAFVRARDQDPLPRADVRAAGRTQIITKMQARTNKFLASPVGIRTNAYLEAGGIDGGILGLQHRAEPFIETALEQHPSAYLAFSHGDPCLSNILFDGRIGLVRLIDPRGAVNRADAMMHPLYDVAKFSHSICGGYDFVNNGLFSIEVNDTLGLELQRHRGGAPDWMRNAFCAKLNAEGWDYAQVRAVEASLFLSMLPLHLDHKRKLIAFALSAQEIIQEMEETTHG